MHFMPAVAPLITHPADDPAFLDQLLPQLMSLRRLAGRADPHLLLAASPLLLRSRDTDGRFSVTFISESAAAQLSYHPERFTDDPGFWEMGLRLLDDMVSEAEQLAAKL